MTTRTDILQIRLTTDGSGKVKAELADVEQGLGKVNKTASATDVVLAKAKGALAGLGLAAVATQIIKTTANFEQYQARLVTVTGSQAAANAQFDKLRQLAATTPFQLSEMVDGFIKLTALGIQPSESALISYGNTAAAMGKQLDQFVEAVADAATGEFERLKEFGIRASAEGENVAFTFQGVTTRVGNNAKEITEYLEGIGNNQFAGAMERQANTLSGAWSNLVDSSAELANSIGSILSPVLQDITRWLADAASEAAEFTQWLGKILTFDMGPVEELNDRIESVRNQLAAARQELQALQEQPAPTNTSARGKAADIRALEERIEGLKAAEADLVKTQQELIDGLNATAPAAAKAADGLNKPAKEAKETASEAAKLTDRLRELVDFYGLTEAEAVRLEAAKGALAAKTAEEREAVLASAEAYATLLENTAEARTRQEALREGMDKLREVVRKLKDDQTDYNDALADTIDRYDPLQAEIRELEADIRRLQAATAAGDQGAATALANAIAQRNALLRDASKIQIEEARQTADEVTNIWLDGTEAVGDIIADGLINGFEDTGEQLERLFKQLLADLARTAIQNAIIIPIQQQIIGTGGQSGYSGLPQFLQGSGTGYGNYGALGSLGGYGDLLGGVLGNAAIGGAVGGTFFGGSTQNQIGGTIGGVIGGAFAGTATGAALIGGGLSAIGVGASLGSVVPVVGTIIGAILGAALGQLFESDPRVRVGDNRSGATGSSQLDDLIGVDSDELGPNNSRQVVDAIEKMDNALADAFEQLGYTADEVNAVRAALANWTITLHDSEATVENVIRARLATIIEAIEPEFAAFINSIDDLEDRVAALEGIKRLKNQVEALDAALEAWGADSGADPLTVIREQITELRQSIVDSQAALDAAIDAQDPAAAAQAAAELQAAIIQRYELESQLIANITQQLQALEASSRQFEFGIAGRLADLSGDRTGVIGLAGNEISRLANNILTSDDTQQALADLDQFVAMVDVWLRESRAQVQAWLAEQQAAINARLQALAEEEAAIYAAADARLEALRAEREAQADQVAQIQQQTALYAAGVADYYASISAQQQAAEAARLAISQQWLSVLEQARQTLDAMIYSAANPISGFGRLALLDQRIEDLTEQLGTARGEDRPEIASQLVQLINDRLGQAQQLFQRPSTEFLTIYNDSIRRLREIEQIADDESDLAERQAALQEATYSATYGISQDVPQITRAIREEGQLTREFTAEEQEALDRIERERRELQEALNAAQLEAAARLRAIDQRATEFYTWAQKEQQRLVQERHEELRGLLEDITGGLDPESYLAGLQAQSRDYLLNIRDDLRAFLGILSSTGAGAGVGPVAPGYGGGSGTDPGETRPLRPKPGVAPKPTTAVPPGEGNITLVVQVSGRDAATIQGEVRQVIERDLPQIATALKRELRAA